MSDSTQKSNILTQKSTNSTVKPLKAQEKTPFLSRTFLDAFKTCKPPAVDASRELHLFSREPPDAIFGVLHGNDALKAEKRYTHPLILSHKECKLDTLFPLFSSLDPGGLYLPIRHIETLRLEKRGMAKTRYGMVNKYAGPVTLKVPNGYCDGDLWLTTLSEVLELPESFNDESLPQYDGILDIYVLRSHGVIFNAGETYIVSVDRWEKTFARFNARPLGFKVPKMEPTGEEVVKTVKKPSFEKIEKVVEPVDQENSPVKKPTPTHSTAVKKSPQLQSWDSDSEPDVPKKSPAFRCEFDSSEDEA